MTLQVHHPFAFKLGEFTNIIIQGILSSSVDAIFLKLRSP